MALSQHVLRNHLGVPYGRPISRKFIAVGIGNGLLSTYRDIEKISWHSMRIFEPPLWLQYRYVPKSDIFLIRLWGDPFEPDDTVCIVHPSEKERDGDVSKAEGFRASAAECDKLADQAEDSKANRLLRKDRGGVTGLLGREPGCLRHDAQRLAR
jgi:hypothetical protein